MENPETSPEEVAILALFQELIQMLKEQGRPDEDLVKINHAFEMARIYHESQTRKSGEPYIIHPLNVAVTLSRLNTDTETICAGLLHDVLEDTTITYDEIKEKFGKEVLKIVEGVTKLNRLNFLSKRQELAENFRKLFLAIASDVRVVLVKLADRLHNMSTLEHLSPQKQKDIASETMEIFAPLANRFGLNYFKWRLEDLAFKYLNPDDYRRIEEIVRENRNTREAYLNRIVKLIGFELDEMGMKAEIKGRVKHFYSIYTKIKRLNSEEIFDLLAVRIVVEKERQCYEVLGIIHDIFQPLPGRFKDYIAIPKSNMYRSLHTTVIGPDKKLIEVQIRTHEMHQIAEFGIAAHWKYKEKGASVASTNEYDTKLSALREKFLELQKELPEAHEYKDAVQIDIFSDEIFIFSPKGDVFCLPKGSTPVDFAYYVHTEIGNHCIGAKVNEKLVSLSHVLKNGDIVFIQTSKSAHPSTDWLSLVKSNSAKAKIRYWLRKNRRSQYVEEGIKIAIEGIGRNQFDDLQKRGAFLEISSAIGWNSEEELFFRLGTADISLNQLIGRLKNKQLIEKEQQETAAVQGKLPLLDELATKKAAPTGSVQELKKFLHSFAKCCQPIPGEEIIGVISRGRGIIVHKTDCPNVKDVEQERLIRVSWGEADMYGQNFTTTLEIECIDRIGISRDILDKIANEKINVLDVRVMTRPSKNIAVIRLSIQIASLKSLNLLISSISLLSDVIQVKRSSGRLIASPKREKK